MILIVMFVISLGPEMGLQVYDTTCLDLYFILAIEYDGYVYGYVYGYVMFWPSRFSSESSVPAINVVIKI